MYTVERYDMAKHGNLVNLMELGEEATQMALAVPQVKSLGFSITQVLMMTLIVSVEAYVVINKQTGRIIGIGGMNQYYKGSTVVHTPWLYSSEEFQCLPGFLHRFCMTLLEKWTLEAPDLTLYGEVPRCSTTQRLLRSLGFTLSITNDTISYYKEGGTHVHSPNDTNECRVLIDGDTLEE